MRWLSPALAAALDQQIIRPAWLAEIELRSMLLWVWSGQGELIWRGRRFGNASAAQTALGGVSNVEESGDVKSTGVVYTLSGISPTTAFGRSLIELAQTDVKRGGTCKLWFAAMNANGALEGEPFLIADTRVDFPNIRIPPDDITVALQTETRRVRHKVGRGRRITHEDHQLDHPGDMIYEFVNELQDKSI